MKKIAIVSLSMLLSACVSKTYTTDITSESHREEYQSTPSVVSAPVNNKVQEDTNTKVAQLEPVAQSSSVKETKPKASIAASTEKQNSQQRYGYTLQVVAVGTESKANQFNQMLPQQGQPIWENYKMVNGTKWYTILYGDYATHEEAKRAIATLPANFQALKPFVKSIDSIKKSEFPSLKKLN
ncbi:cytochrome C biogenesis protein CcdA [Vibrio sp. 10N.286.49.B3]|uniref:SPOR domain-containing protein n=1 Tax=Vibrio sp. 10N.286.49.B3 TaxID=1880855 RepID=UPI000C840D58|nr:SPOR domain-containing protein [Vibrio sp. 10N.286.49.B3]PMH41429.1 cytochrome C biogenesis protein CcdA [Vibrio sp. 10N.286.49.B3]